MPSRTYLDQQSGVGVRLKVEDSSPYLVELAKVQDHVSESRHPLYTPSDFGYRFRSLVTSCFRPALSIGTIKGFMLKLLLMTSRIYSPTLAVSMPDVTAV